MKKFALFFLSMLLLPACCSLQCTGNGKVQALTDSELAYLDNLTSGSTNNASNNEDAYMPSPASDDPWYLNRLRHFPGFYYDPYYSYYYPYAYPYSGIYGYPWRYYDDDDHHDHDWYTLYGRSGGSLADTLENMRDRQQDQRENFQNCMHERRENRQERFENIRDTIHDMFSRCRSLGLRDNRRDDFGSGFPQRENHGPGSGKNGGGNWFKGGRR
ncbi:MAG: hypothetical protein JW832_10430 [Deltaproteobacteria bacterium]|nr:hypothetical protein [Deltaproteobacteria bacterium]